MTKKFHEQLNHIILLLDNSRGQYTGRERGGNTLTTEDDLTVSDKIDLLIMNGHAEIGTTPKEELRRVQRKIKEAYHLVNDLFKDLIMYE